MKNLRITALTRATMVSSALALCAVGTSPASAAAPQVKTSAPGYFRMMLGDFEVTALSDGTVDLPVDKLLNEPAAKTQRLLAAAHLAVPLETSVNAYLVNTGDKLILIDTGAGALFGPTLGQLVANLKASGYKPEDVDDICITHMHPDHVGGLVANGTTVFPHAVIHADKRDSDFWLSNDNLEHAPADSKDFFKGAMASVNPYVSAGKYQPFDGRVEIAGGVSGFPSYGHTAGHTSYAIESKGQKLVVVGDLIHVGAIQFGMPAVTVAFDSDPKSAAKSRAAVFSDAARQGYLIAAAHISFPGMGRLRMAGKGYEWMPVNYTQIR
ncbi:MAG: MBL fold metallo-hydrolase [Pseudomonadota bacterium]|nr:MBL fold metallo-hydrolase [Pseudomonadota bacterium]